ALRAPLDHAREGAAAHHLGGAPGGPDQKPDDEEERHEDVQQRVQRERRLVGADGDLHVALAEQGQQRVILNRRQRRAEATQLAAVDAPWLRELAGDVLPRDLDAGDRPLLHLLEELGVRDARLGAARRVAVVPRQVDEEQSEREEPAAPGPAWRRSGAPGRLARPW